MLTKKQGKELINLARKTIEGIFEQKELHFKKEQKDFPKKLGVFVTLYTLPKKELRGCVGFPYPEKPLAEAVVEAAKAAAFSDFRFKPLTKQEFKKIIIEISVLTEPQLIQEIHHEIPQSIKIGKDGLIIQFTGFSGLLLPQVASEQKWDTLEFLRGTCIKAGLPAETWLNPECKIFKFQAQIFSVGKKSKGN